jgi:hypothetical protein
LHTKPSEYAPAAESTSDAGTLPNGRRKGSESGFCCDLCCMHAYSSACRGSSVPVLCRLRPHPIAQHEAPPLRRDKVSGRDRLVRGDHAGERIERQGPQESHLNAAPRFSKRRRRRESESVCLDSLCSDGKEMLPSAEGKQNEYSPRRVPSRSPVAADRMTTLKY